MHRFLIPRKAWLDITLLTAGLLSANFLLSRGDLGWLGLQPTPYILLPVLAGMRYGMGGGLLAGVLPFLIAQFGHPPGGGFSWHGVVVGSLGLLGSGIILGAMCGHLQIEFQRIRSAQTARNKDLAQRLQNLDDELSSLRQARDELNRMVALRDRERSSLDTGLRWLSASNPQHLARNTLQLLNRQTRVTDAAIYYLDRATGSMHREALLGHEEQLPPRFDPAKIEVARAALNKKGVVAVPELLSAGSTARQDYLAAVPFVTGQGEPFGMLLITGMPFMAFTPKVIKLIELVCQWASSFIELKDESIGKYRFVEEAGESLKIYSPDFFSRVVRISAEAFQEQRVLSRLVLVCAPEAPMSLQPEMESVLMRLIRKGDYVSQFWLGAPHLVVLLPLTGERGSAIFEERVLSAWPRKDYELAVHQIALERESDLQTLLCKLVATRAPHESI
jgi:hypothetical protein